MKFRILGFLGLLFLFSPAFPQFFVNLGQLNIPSGNLVILGSYQNQDSGNIKLDGSISLTGNWTNNSTNTVMAAADGTGTVIFNGSSLQTIGGSSTSYFNFEGITINTGAFVQVQAGMGVTAAGPCVFNTPLVLKSTASVYHPKTATFIDNGSVTGNISMEFSYTSNGIASAGGHGQFFSSPVSNETNAMLGPFVKDTTEYYTWKIIKTYEADTAPGQLPLPFTIMKGYLYRSNVSSVIPFTGPPNIAPSYSISSNGDTVQPRYPGNSSGYYVTGNPYPAVIDWNTNVTQTNLNNTYYVRAYSVLYDTMVVDSYNGSSGAGASQTGDTLDGKIPPMQGFWIKVSGVGLTGDLTISKPGSSVGHTWGRLPFLLKSAPVIDNDIFKLKIIFGSLKDETVIVQSDFAKDELDPWDSYKFFNEYGIRPEIYTRTSDGSDIVIQSVKPVSREKVFPIGMKIKKNGLYQFYADLSKTHSEYDYFLEDKQLGILQDLRSKPVYAFASEAVKDSLGNRFVIHIALSANSLESPNSISINSSNYNALQIYSLGKDIHIRNCEPNQKIIIYNLLGSQVYSATTDANEEVISLNTLPGLYIVKLEHKNNWIAKKVLLN